MAAPAGTGGVRNPKSAARPATTDAADPVVLQHAPRKIPPKELWQTRALLTVVGEGLSTIKCPGRRNFSSRA